MTIVLSVFEQLTGPVLMQLMLTLFHFCAKLSQVDGNRANQIIQPSYTSFSNNDETRFEIEIPGAAQQDVSLELNDRKLVLTAKRFAVEESQKTSTPAAENSDEEGSSMKLESVDTDPASAPVLKYHLVMKLGPRSNFDAISSQLSNGVLSIRIPHAAVAKPRSIQIGA